MQSLYEQYTYFTAVPDWVGLLCIALLYSWTLVVAGIVALRTGRGPFWAMLLFLPYFGFLLAWLLAFTVWPRDRQTPLANTPVADTESDLGS